MFSLNIIVLCSNNDTVICVTLLYSEREENDYDGL